MNNSEYLRYALVGKKDIIHKLQDDIRKLEMDKEQLKEEKRHNTRFQTRNKRCKRDRKSVV